MPPLAVNATTLAYDDIGPRDGIPLLLSHSLFLHQACLADSPNTATRRLIAILAPCPHYWK